MGCRGDSGINLRHGSQVGAVVVETVGFLVGFECIFPNSTSRGIIVSARIHGCDCGVAFGITRVVLSTSPFSFSGFAISASAIGSFFTTISRSDDELATSSGPFGRLEGVTGCFPTFGSGVTSPGLALK